LIYREASHEIAQSFTVKECSVWRGVVGYLQQGTVAVNYATIKQKLPQLQVIAVPESSSHLSERVAERRRAGTRENCGDHVLKQLHNT
jgi:Tfp pilus assembly ATPase PilU